MLHYLHQEHVEVKSENLFDELTSKYLSVIRQFNNIDQNKLNQLIKQIKNTKNFKSESEMPTYFPPHFDHGLRPQKNGTSFEGSVFKLPCIYSSAIGRPNSRRALALAVRITSSAEMPRISASTAAVYRTKSGRLRLPRLGTGAR